MTWAKMDITEDSEYGKEEERRHDVLKTDHYDIQINLQTIEKLLNDFNSMKAPLEVCYDTHMLDKVRNEITSKVGQINCWSVDYHNKIAVFATDHSYHTLCIYWLKGDFIFSTQIENYKKGIFGKKESYVKPLCIDINDNSSLIAVGLESGQIQVINLKETNKKCSLVNIGWIEHKEISSPIIKLEFIRNDYNIFFVDAKYRSYICKINPPNFKIKSKFIVPVLLNPERD